MVKNVWQAKLKIVLMGENTIRVTEPRHGFFQSHIALQAVCSGRDFKGKHLHGICGRMGIKCLFLRFAR